MCGIAGFIDSGSASSTLSLGPRPRLERMLNAIQHRGPDDWGMTFFGFPSEQLGVDNVHVHSLKCEYARVGFGHRRLAILDLSAAGRQPMMSTDSEFTITFNGEIYNYIELREELRRVGVAFRTCTDTEVLLEAYRHWGVEMLPRLDGMFAFALWDSVKKKLVCARDPLAIKPFYYGINKERFVFGSEPRSVLLGLDSPGYMDGSHVAEFIVLGIADYDNGTHYHEVRQLRGGQWIEVSPDTLDFKLHAFWQPPDLVEEPDDVPVAIRNQLDLAVRRQLRSDVPVGACLSGGLDSGSIVTSVGEYLGPASKDFTTLTLFNKSFEGDETKTARATAERAGVNWIPVETDLGQIPVDLENLVRRMDEPFSGLSILGSYKVMQKAHSLGLKVMLDGQGGDEVLLGYPRVAQRVVFDMFRAWAVLSAVKEWKALRRNMREPLAASLGGSIYFSTPYLVRWRCTQRVKGLISRALLDQVRSDVVAEAFGAWTTKEAQVGELTRFCLPRLLRYEDRNSMAFGVEARVPLLSVGLVETALKLPLHWKVRNGWTKYALRMAVKSRLPDEVVWHRHKRGFEVPQGRWVEAAQPQISKWLEDFPSEYPVNIPEMLARMRAGHASTQWFWRCVSVALWMRFSGVRV